MAGSCGWAPSWCAPLHTPGHRPEHTAFLLIDTVRGEEPWAVLSGDSLFVGDVARTDLADRALGEGHARSFAPCTIGCCRCRMTASCGRLISAARCAAGPG